MSKYFTPDGWFNTGALFTEPQPLCVAVSMRGPGKTYGAIKWLIQNATEDEKYILMRRSKAELDLQEKLDPYKEVCIDNGLEPITIDRIQDGVSLVFRGEEQIGTHLSLHGVAGINGVNLFDHKYWFFDEFIPTPGSFRKKREDKIMRNAYETIARNRELKGMPPIKLVMCANMHEPYSEILEVFGYTDELDRVGEANPIAVIHDEDRKLLLINQTEISRKKKDTFLYRVNKDKEFEDMALNNKFSMNLMDIKDYGRKTYTYLATVGPVNINRLKDNNRFYLTKASNTNDTNIATLRRWASVYAAHTRGQVIAQSNYVASKFIKLYNG